jgi:hypothetical protein
MRRLLLDEAGYFEIKTPLIYDKKLRLQSDHWGKYRENMFLILNKEQFEGFDKFTDEQLEKKMVVMGRRSYRELPLRYHTQDVPHRNEEPGALGGLTRVHQFAQDRRSIARRRSSHPRTAAFVRGGSSVRRVCPGVSGVPRTRHHSGSLSRTDLSIDEHRRCPVAITMRANRWLVLRAASSGCKGSFLGTLVGQLNRPHTERAFAARGRAHASDLRARATRISPRYDPPGVGQTVGGGRLGGPHCQGRASLYSVRSPTRCHSTVVVIGRRGRCCNSWNGQTADGHRGHATNNAKRTRSRRDPTGCHRCPHLLERDCPAASSTPSS